jgi:uncharacterized membrane protein
MIQAQLSLRRNLITLKKILKYYPIKYIIHKQEPKEEIMNSSRIALIAHLLNLVIIIALFMFCIQVYNELPDQIPTHYNFSGQPNRWTERSMGSWLTIPVIFVFVTAFLYSIAIFLPKFASKPNLVNLPPKSKEKFMAMTLDQRRIVLKSMSVYFFWFPVFINLMILWMRYEEYKFIVFKLQAFAGMWGFLILVIGFSGVIIAMVKGINRTFNEITIK